MFLSCFFIIGGLNLNAYAEDTDLVLKLHEKASELINSGDILTASSLYKEILEIEPDNAFTQQMINEIGQALETKANAMINLECESYQDCPPRDAIKYLERVLDVEPDNKEVLVKRNMLLTNVRLLEEANSPKSDYVINVQNIIRNSQGVLVSVSGSIYTAILPTTVLDSLLDEIVEKQDTILYIDGGERYFDEIVFAEKNTAYVDGEEYVRWYVKQKHTQNEVEFMANVAMFATLDDPVIEQRQIEVIVKVIDSSFSAITMENGDQSTIIFEILKKN